MHQRRKVRNQIMLWSRKDFHLLRQAMTNFVRSDKQVLARQAAEMHLCSSENTGLNPGWQGALEVAHTVLPVLAVCSPFLRNPCTHQRRTMEIGQKTGTGRLHPVIRNSTNTYGVDTYIILAITAGAEIRIAATRGFLPGSIPLNRCNNLVLLFCR